MSAAYDKWPQAWKDQYNDVLRQRNEILVKQHRIEQINYPKLSEIPLTEDNVFATLAHFFPLNHLIVRILKEAVPETKVKTLLLNWKQVYDYQSVFSGYYSDREKIILLLNHYRFKRDIDKLIELAYYSDEDTYHCYWRLIIGLIFLDLYLKDLRNDYLLERSIVQLGQADIMVEQIESRQAVGALLAFCYYMKKDFEKSRICLRTPNPERFHDRFEDLIKRVA